MIFYLRRFGLRLKIDKFFTKNARQQKSFKVSWGHRNKQKDLEIENCELQDELRKGFLLFEIFEKHLRTIYMKSENFLNNINNTNVIFKVLRRYENLNFHSLFHQQKISVDRKKNRTSYLKLSNCSWSACACRDIYTLSKKGIANET